MKNRAVLVSFLVCTLGMCYAVAQSVDAGTMDAYGGVSFIYPRAKNYILGADYKAKAPMFFLGVDYGLSEQFTFGIQFTKSYFHSDVITKDPTNPGTVLSTQAIDLSMTGFYGVGKWFVPLKIKNMQPYVSLQPQFFVYSYKYIITSAQTGQSGDPYHGSSAKVYLGAYAGTRYSFSNRLSAFGELGVGGWSVLNVGASYQFKK